VCRTRRTRRPQSRLRPAEFTAPTTLEVTSSCKIYRSSWIATRQLVVLCRANIDHKRRPYKPRGPANVVQIFCACINEPRRNNVLTHTDNRRRHGRQTFVAVKWKPCAPARAFPSNFPLPELVLFTSLPWPSLFDTYTGTTVPIFRRHHTTPLADATTMCRREPPFLIVRRRSHPT
jgi:hypothetical protein